MDRYNQTLRCVLENLLSFIRVYICKILKHLHYYEYRKDELIRLLVFQTIQTNANKTGSAFTSYVQNQSK